MPQLAFHARQPAADLPQRVRAAQLAEQHRNELISTRESARMPLGAVILNRMLEFEARK